MTNQTDGIPGKRQPRFHVYQYHQPTKRIGTAWSWGITIKPNYILLHERQDKRDRYRKCLITTLQSKPTTTYFWLRTQSSFIDGQIEPLKCLGVDTVPSVRFPKHGAILPLRPFQLCDSSFKSPWRLKSYCTSLNVQIGEVFEILTGQVVRSRVTTSDYSASFNIRIRKRLERTDWSVWTDFVLLKRGRRKSNPSSASIVMLPLELCTA